MKPKAVHMTGLRSPCREDDQIVIFTNEDLFLFRISNYGTKACEGQIQHSNDRKLLPTEENAKKVVLYTYKT